MTSPGAVLGLLLVLVPWTASAQSRNGDHGSAPLVRAGARSAQIQLDGRLNEADWNSASAASGFVQFEPVEGAPATQRTEVRFVFDADAMYIGARMYDAEGAAGVRTRLSRRDQVNEGDYIQFVLDTFHDHTGRTIFTVSPSGSYGDEGQAAPFADPSWDPIWQAATQIDSLGWSAELRIPFSQLRYPARPEQTWGVQIWRYVERLNELTMWSFWGRQEMGGPQRFGHLEGLRIEPRKLGVEILPYVVTRAEHVRPAQPTPLREANQYALRAGADIKALLTSTLTLDATINPDFGQVEVDPAVVNLSAFETFFEEKRPFFIEGSGLFGFGGFNCYFCSNVSSLSLFYSRRIGRRPQGSVAGDPEFVEIPENSTILGAAKITGRTADGYQLGILNAVTASEDAKALMTAGATRFEEEVEPLTNYFVGRVKKNFAEGNATVGAIATSVVRSFDNDALRALLPTHAEAIGLDWNVWWKRRTYNLMGNLALSQVSGRPAAMLRVQNSSARYFSRPDREHGNNGFLTDRFDPGLEQMRGAGGYVRLAKDAGAWLMETAANVRTPGFEVNDLAFLTRADYAWFLGNVLRQWTKPTRYYRQVNVTLGGQLQYNFDGDVTERQIHSGNFVQLPSYWNVSSFLMYRPEVIDDRLTRGGPAVRRAGMWVSHLSASTDPRKRLVISANAFYNWTAEDEHSVGGGTQFRVKPASNITVSLGPNYSRNGSAAQYVQGFTDASATHFYGQRVVFSDLTQHTLAMDTRISATFSPELTLELFAQPFVSTGDYFSFKEFVAPRGLEKRAFDAQQLHEVRDSRNRLIAYDADPDRNAATEDFRFDNPDFNFRSLRGNAVLRWEYRPGSTLFLVWQQERSDSERFGDFDAARDAGAVFRGRPDSIFLLKMTYWLGR